MAAPRTVDDRIDLLLLEETANDSDVGLGKQKDALDKSPLSKDIERMRAAAASSLCVRLLTRSAS